MAEEKFNLSDYTQAVLQIAKENNVAVEVAFQCFLANLSTMKEHYKGASELNYHALGQQCSKLLSRERVTQKEEMRIRLSRYSKGGNS